MKGGHRNACQKIQVREKAKKEVHQWQEQNRHYVTHLESIQKNGLVTNAGLCAEVKGSTYFLGLKRPKKRCQRGQANATKRRRPKVAQETESTRRTQYTKAEQI